MIETGNQLKGYMQRESKAHNIHSNYAYNYYFMREFLNIIANYSDVKFVLKGSYSNFANTGMIYRPLTDIDLVTKCSLDEASSEINKLTSLHKKIQFQIKNEFLTDNSTLNYRIFCDFDNKNKTISLDLKSEETLSVEKLELPKLFTKDLHFDVFSISIEELLANKLTTVLFGLDLCNKENKEFRRFKDLYDIHSILGNNQINHEQVSDYLTYAIKTNEYLSSYLLRGNLFNKTFVTENQEKWDKDKRNLEYLNDVSFKEAAEITSDYISRKR